MCIIAYQIAAVTHLSEGQFLHDTGNKTKFPVLQCGTLKLILPISEAWINKEHQFVALKLVEYVTSETKFYKYKEYVEDQLKHRASNFCWICSSLLASVVVMLFQTD
jgi:hypothetical protein